MDDANIPTVTLRPAETWLSGLSEATYLLVEHFLRKSSGRRIAMAANNLDQVIAVHDFLNSFGLPPSMTVYAGRQPRADCRRYSLPACRPLPKITLQETLEARRSTCGLAESSISIFELADLLSHAVHIYQGERTGTVGQSPLSNSPSAGGFNAVQIYVINSQISGLRDGVYRYDRSEHCLDLIFDCKDPENLLREMLGQPEFADPYYTTLVVTAQLSAPISRYGPRHYRTLHLDSGVVVQNFYLVSTALGLSGCAVSGYRDKETAAIIDASPDEIVMVVFSVGRHGQKC